LTYSVLINKRAQAFIDSLSSKIQAIVKNKIRGLSHDPCPGKGSDKERLHVHGREDTYRLNISRSFTAFYRIHDTPDGADQEIHVLAVMTSEKAHKRYGRL